MSMSKSKWVVQFRPKRHTTLRLFCFPFAGGGSVTYRPWAQTLPDFVDVCAIVPPGRERRIREKPFDTMSALALAAADGIEPYLDQPFVFFGHSMGSVMAFEVARELQRRGLPQPIALFPSGRRAPNVLRTSPTFHHLPDKEMIDAIQDHYQQIPKAVTADPELRALITPLLRGDFTAIDTYEYEEGDLLNCPFVAFGGTQDEASVEQMQAWGEFTTGSFQLHMLAGGHFFLNEQRPQLLQLLTQYLHSFRRAALGMAF